MSKVFNSPYNNTIDFVIPLHRYHYMLRTVIESIQQFYSPKMIYIIAPKLSCDMIIKNEIPRFNRNLCIIPEESFFVKNHNLHYQDIYELFTQKKSDYNREFGWWYQQLIKLGAFQQIEGLSDPYIVWDSDLIPIQRWDIYPSVNSPYYTFAILQEQPRSQWLLNEYSDSLYELTGLSLCEPSKGGTFVPHHFIFHHLILVELFALIEIRSQVGGWIQSIIQLSHTFYRFSEYHMMAAFMNYFYKPLLCYHSIQQYGKRGIRIRDSQTFLKDMDAFFVDHNTDVSQNIAYSDFLKFVEFKYGEDNIPTYLQIEHI